MAKKKERGKIYRLVLISGVIVILIFAVFFLNNMAKEKEQPQSKSSSLTEEYPHNLIEGQISEIDSSKPASFILEADTSKISTAKTPSMKKTIKLTSKTELVLYDMTTKKESPLKFSELEKGDPVVIGTKESTYEKVNELDQFTATKISKFVNIPGE